MKSRMQTGESGTRLITLSVPDRRIRYFEAVRRPSVWNVWKVGKVQNLFFGKEFYHNKHYHSGRHLSLELWSQEPFCP